MVPSVWIVAAFLAGAAVGALLVAIHRITTLSRLREEFATELQKLTESNVDPSSDNLVPQGNRTRRAA